MAEVLKFQTNVAHEVALAYGDGRRVEGNYGPQIMYSLADGRVMYLPLEIEAKIAGLRLSDREPFQICKAEVRQGQRKRIEWQVKRVYVENAPAEAATSTGAVKQRPADSMVKLSSAQFDSIERQVPGPQVRNGGRPEFRNSAIRQMEAAGVAAVSIVRNVEQHAAGAGVSLRFNNEDVRAIWLSLFIQAARDGASLV